MTYYNASTTTSAPKRPSVYLTPLAHRKLLTYTRLCPVEISGFGFVELLPEQKGFLVTDLILLPQKCSAGGTEIEANVIGQLATTWIQEGKEDLNEKLKCWWH